MCKFGCFSFSTLYSVTQVFYLWHKLSETCNGMHTQTHKNKVSGWRGFRLWGEKNDHNKVWVHVLASGQATSPETGLNLPSVLWLVNLFLTKPIRELTNVLLWGQLGCRGKVSKQSLLWPFPPSRERTPEVNVYVPWHEDVVFFLKCVVGMFPVLTVTKSSFTFTCCLHVCSSHSRCFTTANVVLNTADSAGL